MASKEKAMHLVEKMYFSRRYKNGEDYIAQQAWLHAIKCALIAVDEIMYYLEIVLGVDKEDFEYWQEVKQEIELL